MDPSLGDSRITHLVRLAQKAAESLRGDAADTPELLAQVEAQLRLLSIECFENDPRFAEALVNNSDFDQCQVYDDGYLAITLMLFPKAHSYPLHDHPQMTVLTKVLHGRCVLTETSLVTPEQFYGNPDRYTDFVRLQRFEETLKLEGEVSRLDRHSPNLHALTSDQGCVVLDVMFNYYTEERPCSFFYAEEEGPEGVVWATARPGTAEFMALDWGGH